MEVGVPFQINLTWQKSLILFYFFVLESKNCQRKSTCQIFNFFFNTGDDPEIRENLGDRRVRVPGSAHRQTLTGKDGLRQRNTRTGSETLHQATRFVIKSLRQIFYITEKGQKIWTISKINRKRKKSSSIFFSFHFF